MSIPETCGLHGITNTMSRRDNVKEIICDYPTYRVGTPPCEHPQALCQAHFTLVPLMRQMTCETCNSTWDISTISWAAPNTDDEDGGA